MIGRAGLALLGAIALQGMSCGIGVWILPASKFIAAGDAIEVYNEEDVDFAVTIAVVDADGEEGEEVYSGTLKAWSSLSWTVPADLAGSRLRTTVYDLESGLEITSREHQVVP